MHHDEDREADLTMTTTIYKSRTFPYPHYGLIAGRIEIDLADPHRPMQRHIWIKEDGREDAEGWIPSLPTTSQRLLDCMWTAA